MAEKTGYKKTGTKKNTKERKTAKAIKDKKKAKPTFQGFFGQKQFKKKSVNRKWTKWRKPQGIDSKGRRKVKCAGLHPGIGYRTAKAIRGLHPTGLKEKLVANPKELEVVEKGYAVRIKGTVGAKKKEAIRAEAEKKGLRLLN